MSIELVEVEIPFAGITALEVEVVNSVGARGEIPIITSTTAPTDTTAIWLDPESGIYAAYVGGGWTTQYIVTSADGAYLDANGNPYLSPTGNYYLIP